VCFETNEPLALGAMCFIGAIAGFLGGCFGGQMLERMLPPLRLPPLRLLSVVVDHPAWGRLARALHGAAKACLTRRKLRWLIGGSFIVLVGLWLWVRQRDPSQLHRVYDGIKTGMTAAEVCDVLGEVYTPHAPEGRGFYRLTELPRMLPDTDWTMTGHSDLPERLYVHYDANLRVSRKAYDPPIAMRLHRWLYNLRRWLD
jgi:hypothetical protein